MNVQIFIIKVDFNVTPIVSEEKLILPQNCNPNINRIGRLLSKRGLFH